MNTFEIEIASRGGERVCLDAMELVRTRLLIQANSGGGKSGLFRKIVEQCADRLQTIVIDPEGEFSTVREVVGAVLVGQGGELPATVKTAGKVSRKLVEVGSSAVVDVSDLSLGDRREYVGAFLGAMMSAPSKFYHPMLVLIDEAHLFCPEREPCASTSGVVSLMSQGRKRGFCGVLSTQRLSKLHKDAASECNNVCIGRTTLDIDQRRAGDALGVGKAEYQALKQLKTREFWAYGPAFAASFMGVERIRVADCSTQPPKAGARQSLTPPARLPKGLVAELRTAAESDSAEPVDLETALREIKRLERELKSKERAAPPSAGPVQGREAADLKSLRGQVRALEAERDKLLKSVAVEVESAVRETRREISDKVYESIGKLLGTMNVARDEFYDVVKWIRSKEPIGPARSSRVDTLRERYSGPPVASAGDGRNGHDGRSPRRAVAAEPDTAAIGGGKIREMLTWLARFYPDGCDRKKLAALSGMSIKGSGTFRTHLATLRREGYIEGDGGELRATAAGVSAVGDPGPMPTGEELIETWRGIVGGGKIREMFDALIQHGPLIRADLLAHCDMSENASGTFRTHLASLRRLGLIEKGEPVQLSAEFMSAAGIE